MSDMDKLKELLTVDFDAILNAAKLIAEKKQVGRFVLIRTYSAGVHFGTLESREGKEVVLRDARRVCYWKGANTLNELIARGPGEGSKISEPTARVTLTEAIEVIDMTPEQHARLAGASWA